MLKLAKRTAQAEKQAARRMAKQKKTLDLMERKEGADVRTRMNEEIRVQMRQARRQRREAWTMGALAPKHNHAGSAADTARRGQQLHGMRFGGEVFAQEVVPHWGSIHVMRVRGGASPVTERDVERRCAWAGTPKRLCLAVGDRVVLMEGPNKGTIGRVKALDMERATLTMDGQIMTNVTVPEAFAPDIHRSVQSLESAIPIDAVRLVHPLEDPDTGAVRDVIIRELRPTAFQLDRATRRLAFSRVVPGLNVRIPWPQPDNPPPEPEDEAVDTLRIDVEQATFVPTLLRPPAPIEVLDELRNRFSRFRTRHTAEYIAEKEAKEAKRVELRRYANGSRPADLSPKRHGGTPVKGRKPGLPPPEMRTPLDEFHLQQTALRKARGQPELSDDMLERIGRLVLQHNPAVLDQVSAKEETTTSSQ